MRSWWARRASRPPRCTSASVPAWPWLFPSLPHFRPPCHCGAASLRHRAGVICDEVMGTPFYMAPEVYRRRYGPECDFWSLGVVLFLMVSGVRKVLPPLLLLYHLVHYCQSSAFYHRSTTLPTIILVFTAIIDYLIHSHT